MDGESRVEALALESFFAALGYWGVFALVLILNVVPVFMPPTWMVLSLMHVSFSGYFTPLPLAFVGCVASTLGRLVLSYFGTAGRAIMGEARKESLGDLRRVIGSRKGGGFLLSLGVALTPLPSNAYFLAIGVMKYQVLEVFAGFMVGRLLLYWAAVSLAEIAAHSFEELFRNQLLVVAIVDIIGVASTILLTIIDWHKLIEERRFGIIKPRIRRV